MMKCNLSSTSLALQLIRSEKVQAFQELTEDDKQRLEKGLITYNTLNRIEDKQNELKQVLNSMGYWNTPIVTKQWDGTMIFSEDERTRLFHNDEILRQAFFTYADTPSTPSPSYYWQDWNDVEKILVDIEKMIKDVKEHYKECGTFECGEE